MQSRAKRKQLQQPVHTRLKGYETPGRTPEPPPRIPRGNVPLRPEKTRHQPQGFPGPPVSVKRLPARARAAMDQAGHTAEGPERPQRAFNAPGRTIPQRHRDHRPQIGPRPGQAGGPGQPGGRRQGRRIGQNVPEYAGLRNTGNPRQVPGLIAQQTSPGEALHRTTQPLQKGTGIVRNHCSIHHEGTGTSFDSTHGRHLRLQSPAHNYKTKVGINTN